MGLITRLREERSTQISNSTSYYSVPHGQWLRGAIDQQPGKSGAVVTEENAISLSSVFACVVKISKTIASLPLHLYAETESGKQKATEHNLYYLLHDEPNPEQTSFEFRMMMMVYLLLWNRAYAEIVINAAGQVVELWPISPWRVEEKRTESKQKYYEVTLPDQSKKKVPPQSMMCLSGIRMALDDTTSIAYYAKEAIGLGMALEEFGARFFQNGANMGGFVKHPQTMSETAYDRLKREINDKFTGLGKSHRLIILEEGAEVVKLTTNPTDAQSLETRKFQVEEVARFFDMPPHMIQSLERSTFNNIEHQSLEFIIYTLTPYAQIWEQKTKKYLLFGEEKRRYFAKHNFAGLVRGDIKARNEAYSIGRQWGWFCVNDVREMEDMNGIGPEGDIFLSPLNMVNTKLMLSGAVDGEEPENQVAIREKRQKAQVENTVSAYKKIVEDAICRVVKREKADILRKFKSLDDKNEIIDYLPGYFEDNENYFKMTIGGPFLVLADILYSQSSQDLIKNEEKITLIAMRQMGSFLEVHINDVVGAIKDALKGENAIIDIEDYFNDILTNKYKALALGECKIIAHVVTQNDH